MIRMLVSDPKEFYLFVEEVSCFLLEPKKYLTLSRKYETEECARWIEGSMKYREGGYKESHWDVAGANVFLSTEQLWFQIHAAHRNELPRVGKISKRGRDLKFRGVLWAMLDDELSDICRDLRLAAELKYGTTK